MVHPECAKTSEVATLCEFCRGWGPLSDERRTESFTTFLLCSVSAQTATARRLRIRIIADNDSRLACASGIKLIAEIYDPIERAVLWRIAQQHSANLGRKIVGFTARSLVFQNDSGRTHAALGNGRSLFIWGTIAHLSVKLWPSKL